MGFFSKKPKQGPVMVDLERVAQDAQEFHNISSQLEELNNRLSSLIAQIGDSWDGDASAAYIKLLTTENEKNKALKEMTNKYGDRLAEISNTLGDTDKKSKSKFDDVKDSINTFLHKFTSGARVW